MNEAANTSSSRVARVAICTMRPTLSVCIVIHYLARARISGPVFGFEIKRADGLDCFATNTHWDEVHVGTIEGGIVECNIPQIVLAPGHYSLDVGIMESQGIAFYDFHDLAYPFEVVQDSTHRGLVHIPHTWNLDGLG